MARIGGSILAFDEVDHGMSASRQQGFRIAQTFPEPVNEWIEPQKVGMAQRLCLEPTVTPILEGRAALVIPARDEEGFATLNQYQADVERESNLKWTE